MIGSKGLPTHRRGAHKNFLLIISFNFKIKVLFKCIEYTLRWEPKRYAWP